MGDFNTDTSCPNDTHTMRYRNTLLSLGLRNTINKPTRVTPDTETILDHCLTNLNYSSVNSGILEYHISDHHPIFAVANLSVAKAPQSTHYTRRFFSVSK